VVAEDVPITDDEMTECRQLFDEPLPDVSPDSAKWTELKMGIPEGMRVWGALVEGTNVFTFRVSGRMTGVSVDGLIQTMEGFDFEERSKWDPTCLKLDLLSREGNNNNLHLWVVDFPWPMSDREYLLRTRLERYEGGSAASITRIVKNSESVLAKEPENVRIEDFTQSATARPLQDGTGVSFHLIYRNDLQAPIPKWLVKWFSQFALPTYLKQILSQARAYTLEGHNATQ